MAGVDAPKAEADTASRGALTLEQTRQLFRAAKEWRGGRLHPVLVLAVSTGMRQGEIVGLLWEDFDPDRATLTVRRTLHRKKGGWSYGPTKSGKVRTLEIDDRLLALLRDHRRRQLEERVAAPAWTETGHIFTTSEGRPMHRAVLYQSFKRLCKREGLPDIIFHELRHLDGPEGGAPEHSPGGLGPRGHQDHLGHVLSRMAGASERRGFEPRGCYSVRAFSAEMVQKGFKSRVSVKLAGPESR